MQIGALVFFFTCGLAFGQDVDNESGRGPSYGEEDFKLCSGKFQNPINVNHLRVESKDFPQFQYFSFYSTPERMHMTNNGQTVTVTMNYRRLTEPRLRGGPLQTNSSYEFEQFYFHWGATDTIDHDPFLIELHLVLRNSDNGVAVMAFSFMESKIKNHFLDEFMQKLSNISRKGLSVDLEKPFSLNNMIPKNLVNYYSYTGTFATPPCAEKVIWIDYWEPIYISEGQMNSFRQLTAFDEYLKENYNPRHRSNDRIIYKNEPPTVGVKHTNSNPITIVSKKSSNSACRGQTFIFITVAISALLTCLNYY